MFKFILGINTIENTVIEKRIKDVMAMGTKKNQTYKPRQGGTNRNLKNYTPEMIEYTKNYNEDLFHIFGYVKDDERVPDNNTPFLDFEGRAKPESVAKINLYRKLNEEGMRKRMLIKHGDLADQKHEVGPSIDGGVRLITELKVIERLDVINHIDFAH